MLAVKNRAIAADRVHRTRTHVSDGGVLCATTVGPTFTIEGTNAASLFHDATVKVLAGAVDWVDAWVPDDSNIGCRLEALWGQSRLHLCRRVHRRRNASDLLAREKKIPASLRVLGPAHDSEMVNKKEILEWAAVVGVKPTTEAQANKLTLFEFIDSW